MYLLDFQLSIQYRLIHSYGNQLQDMFVHNLSLCQLMEDDLRHLWVLTEYIYNKADWEFRTMSDIVRILSS
jgi:hypothetical protein